MTKHMTVRWQGELDFDATDQGGAIVPMSSKEGVFGPGLMVLAALGGCTGMDAVSVMTKKKVDFETYRVEIEWPSGDATPEIVFAPDDSSKWAAALRSLGVDPLSLSAAAGRA